MVEYKKKKIVLQSGGTRNFYYKVSSNGKKKQVSKKEYLEKRGGHKNNPFNENWGAPKTISMNRYMNKRPNIKIGSLEEENFLSRYNPNNPSNNNKATLERLKEDYLQHMDKLKHIKNINHSLLKYNNYKEYKKKKNENYAERLKLFGRHPSRLTESEKEKLKGIKINTEEESKFLRNYDPTDDFHYRLKNRLKNDALKAHYNPSNLSSKQINLDRKYSENPAEYQIYLDRLKEERSKILTKEEAKKLENERREKERREKEKQAENIRLQEESRRKNMNRGEKYRINTYMPARRSLVEKLGISEKDLDYPTNFIPIFREYIRLHSENSNIIKEMVNYTNIWRDQKEFDNLKSGYDDPISSMFMSPIWAFQKNYEKK